MKLKCRRVMPLDCAVLSRHSTLCNRLREWLEVAHLLGQCAPVSSQFASSRRIDCTLMSNRYEELTDVNEGAPQVPQESPAKALNFILRSVESA